jgi:diaminohydroxyphosphoribosylaminopyrimidine deaminase/5-amino-6-(5-phosphoribosylamino)uracil reductase
MPHAEVNALSVAGSKAKGATAYVTLEPCSHHGLTPPCGDALIAAGVARVVVAMEDPNPLVSGNGLKMLTTAGIDVECGVLASQAGALNRGFISRMQRGRPWVRLKSAISIDGRTAMASGESRWITGEAARRDVQFLRAGCSAIMTGSATVIADDPAMNVRLSREELGIEGKVRQPHRVILDTVLRVPPEAKIFSRPGQCLVLTACEDSRRIESLRSVGAEVVNISRSAKGLHLDEAMRYLGSRKINELHVEAGPVLGGALVAEGIVDELVVYMASHLMGDQARGLVNLSHVHTMAERIPLRFGDIRVIGDDLRITMSPVS